MGQRTEEQIASDIEGTRQDLSQNLDALNERVSPHQIMERRKRATRDRWSKMRGSVMGSAQSAQGRAGSMTSGGQERASSMAGSAQDTAHGAVHAVEQQTEGHPLAAGLIAFGAGMLLSSVIPASEREAQAAGRLVEEAKSHGQPVIDEAKSVGQEMGENLKEKATEATEGVKSSAQESAQHVKDEGQSSAQQVKEETQQKM